MRVHIIYFLLLSLPNVLIGQPLSGFAVGLDCTNLLLGSMEVKAEYPLRNAIIVRMSVGGRKQNSTAPGEKIPAFMSPYQDIRNRSIATSIGLSFADHYAKYYPYFGIDLNGIFVNDFYKEKNGIEKNIRGYTGGIMLGLGYVAPITKRISLDFSGKIGYTHPIQNKESYFFPAAGYSLSGTTESLGASYLSFMPSITLKYIIMPFKESKVIPPVREEIEQEEVEAHLD